MSRSESSKPVIALTVGDFNGIGPEVILKSLLHPDVHRLCHPVLVGPSAVFEYYETKLRLRRLRKGSARFMAGSRLLIETSELRSSSIAPGRVSARAGREAVRAIETAAALALTGSVHAIVSAPLSKQAMHRGGGRFAGQTELLQHLTGSKTVAMLLVSRTMRVGLATTHVPLKKVSRTLTRRLLRDRVRVIHTALEQDWRIRTPRIAVLALNPHAGEGGDLGTEDQKIIAPVVRELQRENLRVEGPLPADAFFAREDPKRYDAIVAMYHDQGLIPLKMSSSGRAVNVTAGLPIVRTSPDHGTAFDIAGKGIADPSSMIEAIRLAARIVHHRRQKTRKGTG